MSWKVIVAENVVPPAAVDILREEALKAENQARVITSAGDAVVNTYRRNARVIGLPGWSDGAKLVWESVSNAAEKMIDQNFPLEYTGWGLTQLLAYHGDEGGNVPWHFDEDMWAPHLDSYRKIATVMFLGGEFGGGRFEFQHLPAVEQKPGMMLLFPIWVRHRVTPVTSGVRTSLVSWRTGPRWR